MMRVDPARPFGNGSISASLYIHGLPASQGAAFLVRQAQIAEDAGFDGVTISEHHAGLFEYVPVPLMGVSWILAATRRIWAGPCPLSTGTPMPLVAAARTPGAGFTAHWQNC